MSENRYDAFAYERQLKKDNVEFWAKIFAGDWSTLRLLEQGRAPDSPILARIYTKEDLPDRSSEAYKRMHDHIEDLYRFDELD